MGVSVSVESWTAQLLEELSDHDVEAENNIYFNIISSATNVSEIFLLEAGQFALLYRKSPKNAEKLINTCLESLTSSDSVIRSNSAAILSRMLPLMLRSDSKIDLQDFLISGRTILGKLESPGAIIIKVAINELIMLSKANMHDILDSLDRSVSLFDLMVFNVTSLIHYYHNSTLFHQLLVEFNSKPIPILQTLMNYVHMRGKQASIMTILAFLVFHPTFEYSETIRAYVEMGGDLSAHLCEDRNDGTDLVRYLCSLAFSYDTANVDIQSNDPNLARIKLVRCLMDKNVIPIPSVVAKVYALTDSLLARALMTRALSNNKVHPIFCPPLQSFVFTNPLDSPVCVAQISNVIPALYLQEKVFWLDESEKEAPKPNLDFLDNLITINTP